MSRGQQLKGRAFTPAQLWASVHGALAAGQRGEDQISEKDFDSPLLTQLLHTADYPRRAIFNYKYSNMGSYVGNRDCKVNSKNLDNLY
jgi:hypothetical protein